MILSTESERKVPGVWSNSCCFQIRNLRNISSLRVLEENIWEKKRITGMIKSVQSIVLTKRNYKLSRKPSTFWRREPADHLAPAIFCTVPRSTGPCMREYLQWFCFMETHLTNLHMQIWKEAKWFPVKYLHEIQL